MLVSIGNPKYGDFQNGGVRTLIDHLPREAYTQLVKIINTKFVSSKIWKFLDEEIIIKENQLNL